MTCRWILALVLISVCSSLFALDVGVGFCLGPTASLSGGEDWDDTKTAMEILMETSIPGLSVSVRDSVGAGSTFGFLTDIAFGGPFLLRTGVSYADYFGPMMLKNDDNSHDWVRTGIKYKFIELPILLKIRFVDREGWLIRRPWYETESPDVPNWSVSLLAGGVMGYRYTAPLAVTKSDEEGDKEELDESSFREMVYRGKVSLEVARMVVRGREPFLELGYTLNLTPLTDYGASAADDTTLHSLVVSVGCMYGAVSRR